MKKFKDIKKIKPTKKPCKMCGNTDNADNLCGVYKCWKYVDESILLRRGSR